ncbi:MAG: AMP-binding enzyme family protein, partial [Neisseriaceae bacterium]|nr:AMP-binding enzyme family protein [Neisseriaceae bacterium]
MNSIDLFFAQVPVLSTLTQRLREEKHTAVALYAHNAVLFTAALAAVWRAGAEVFLLPNLSASSFEWGKQNRCVFLSDSDIIAGVWRIDKMPTEKQCNNNILPDARLWLKTSGSSGEPKIVGKTAGQMVSEALALKATLPEKWQGKKAVSSVSPQHLYGLTFRIFTGLAMGWVLDEYQQMYPEDLAAASDSPCVWIASPALLKRLDAQIDRIVGLNTVQGIISAGGMMP